MSQGLLIVFVSLIGLGMGSFINVITTRFQPDKNISFKKLVSGRSRCPFCLHQIKWYDLIPIFSFVFLKGKCRYCGKKISWQYPIVEILTAIIFVLTFLKFWNLTPVRLALAQHIYSWPIIFFIIFLFYILLLLVLSIIDLKYYIFPDLYIIVGDVVAILVNIYFYFLYLNSQSHFFNCGVNFLGSYIDYFNCQFNPLISALLGIVVASGFLFLIYILSRGKGIGFGDVKLGVFIGLILGFTNSIMAIALAFIFGSIVGIIMLAFKKRTLKSMVPFGPFLALGVLVTILFGSNIVDIYLSLFNLF